MKQKLFFRFKTGILPLVLLFLFWVLLDRVLIYPLFQYLISKLLLDFGLQLDSWTNISLLLTQRSLIAAGLLLTAAFLIYILSWQAVFSFQFGSGSFQVGKTFRAVKGITMLISLNYLLLFAFILGLFFKTPLASRIPLAQFAIEHCLQLPVLLIGLGLFLLLLLFLAFKFSRYYAFLLQEKGERFAAKSSWQENKVKLASKLIGDWFKAVVIILLAALICYCLAKIRNSLLTANILLNCYQLLAVFLTCYCLACFAIRSLKQQFAAATSKPKHYLLLVLLLFLLLFSNIGSNYNYLKQSSLIKPVVISHRGVNQDNAVPNSISALRKTNKLKPAYVEIDLHETQDHNFVVVHDESLKKLTGVNKTPRELTSRQISQLTERANQHRAKIATFTDYLDEAQKLKQKLLIELKTTPQDSRQMLPRFLKRYGKQIMQHQDQIQSLDYHLLNNVQALNPKLAVIQLESYNLVQPIKQRSGYAIEYSALNPFLASQLHEKRQLLYTWTANSRQAVKYSLLNHADGIITDNVVLAKEVVRQTRNISYADLLGNYFGYCF